VSLSGLFELEGFGAEGQRVEGYYNAFFTDYLFLLVCAFLGVSAISRENTLIWRDTVSSRLLILRNVPVSAGSLVGSRVICMLLALVTNALTLFLPAFLFSDLGELGSTSYLWFAGLWIGYGLLTSGLWLLFELGAESRVYALISFGFAATLTVVLVLLEWALDLSLVRRTAELAQENYGALAAILSILVGGAAFALLSRLTVWHLEKRDHSA
jgi:hypothetical protein